ncbi:MAG: hypothetical protein CL946_00705 [Ectothiorhodospiraceae bacterium]|nr:hypothetical protein [Ectothiorhodospiraceae bacterium]
MKRQIHLALLVFLDIVFVQASSEATCQDGILDAKRVDSDTVLIEFLSNMADVSEKFAAEVVLEELNDSGGEDGVFIRTVQFVKARDRERGSWRQDGIIRRSSHPTMYEQRLVMDGKQFHTYGTLSSAGRPTEDNRPTEKLRYALPRFDIIPLTVVPLGTYMGSKATDKHVSTLLGRTRLLDFKEVEDGVVGEWSVGTPEFSKITILFAKDSGFMPITATWAKRDRSKADDDPDRFSSIYSKSRSKWKEIDTGDQKLWVPVHIDLSSRTSNQEVMLELSFSVRWQFGDKVDQVLSLERSASLKDDVNVLGKLSRPDAQ